MPPDPIPKDPVYMSYITRHNQGVRQPSPHRSPRPFRPASGLTYTDLQLQTDRAVYPNFHRPFNDHSRYLAVASPTDRAVYRELPRMSPAPWDGSRPLDYDDLADRTAYSFRRRPASAPPIRPPPGPEITSAVSPNLRVDLRGASLVDNMVTATGRPCYTMTTTLEADVEAGLPVVDPVEAESRELAEWRLRRVQTYQVPPSVVGYGDGGVRPFHQDYRHYKYFGFGGHGAKTSWAHNPKYGRMYGDLLPGATPLDPSGPPLAFQGGVPAPPLQQTVGGPRRKLTPAERALVKQFGAHNYSSEGVPSDPRVTRVLAHVAATGGRAPGSRTLRYHQQRVREPQDRTYGGTATQGEIIEPYRSRVDLDRRQALPLGTRSPGRNTATATTSLRTPYALSGAPNAARVTTYRQMSSPYAGELNRSPNHGSQSPWHQRYGHYKYAGFAGKGATSSWARNPKYAYMYD